MHQELVRYGLYDCHGWAYEACDRPSVWLVIEHWPGGSWAASGLCSEHARQVLEAVESESYPPQARTWWKIDDFARAGSWPQQPDVPV